MPITQSNQLTLLEIHTRPELWKDRIYYLERNPYWNSAYDFLPTPKKYASIIQEFHQEIEKQKEQIKDLAEQQAKVPTRITQIYQQIRELIEKWIKEEEEKEFTWEDHWANFQEFQQWTEQLAQTQPKLAGTTPKESWETEEGLTNWIKELKEKISQWEETNHDQPLYKNQVLQTLIQKIQNFFQNEYEFLANPSLATERFYTQKDLEPYLQETSYEKFKEWEKKWGAITELMASEEDDEPWTEKDLLEQWQQLNQGQPPYKSPEELQQALIKEQEQKKQELIKNLQLGLKKTTLTQFQKWNNKEVKNEALTELLQEWQELINILKKKYNACFIIEHNQEQLKFTFQPPRQVFVNLNEFLFYRSGTWYEVINWERINKNIQHIKLAKFLITEDNKTLDKCSDCKNSFKSEQEYWELKREGQVIMNSCVDCWNKHTFSKKIWEK